MEGERGRTRVQAPADEEFIRHNGRELEDYVTRRDERSERCGEAGRRRFNFLDAGAGGSRRGAAWV